MTEILKEGASIQPPPETEITTSSDRFQFKEIIGRGGMATVYRAFDTQTQRHVAIKVLYEHLREHSLVVEHFRREVAISQRLEHPNIVRIHSLLDTPKTLGLVMELHGEGDLKNYLQRHGAMPHKQVIDIGVQVLSALQSAHDQGIIHQDLKPHNILWDPHTQTAKLIDFGLAQTEQIIALARPESAMGTVEYSAPEQFDDFSTDARADLYSIAITLFELLSNNLPYRSETAAGVIQMHREAPPTDVRIFTRGIPSHLAETLLRAMAKLPEERFANADEMSQALQNQTSTALATIPRSTVWDTLKKNHTTNPEPNNWNVYIQPSQFSDFNDHNLIIGTAYRRALTEILQNHATNINTEHATTYSDRHMDPDTFSLADFDALFVDKALIKKPIDIVRNKNVSDRKLESIAVACNLTFEQAENIRHELGRASIPAKSFQRDTLAKTSHDYHMQRNAFADITKLNQKFIFGTQGVLFILVILLAIVISVMTGIFLAVLFQNELFMLPATLLVPLLIAATSVIPTRRLGFHKHWYLGKLNFSEFYLLDFDPDKTPQLTSDLIGDRHAEIYHQLRSNRVRASFERIILTLLNTANQSDYKEHAQSILNHATDIATRVTELESQLLAQDQTTLFSQLTRLDSMLSKTHNSDHMAELIEQRSALHEQLNRIDQNREELNNLNHELLKIAASLD